MFMNRTEGRMNTYLQSNTCAMTQQLYTFWVEIYQYFRFQA